MMSFDIKDFAREVFDFEIEELRSVRDRISSDLEKAVHMILESEGKVVVTGIGKSGIIGSKIAATLASTGTLAVFMNSAEGVHGDLGMIGAKDVVLAISNSGNTDETVSLLPSIRKIGAKIIAMTGNPNSKLGKGADCILNVGVSKEGCPINLAPMSSTTSTLVMGDAIAAILIKMKNFKPENFALYHPGGSLGKRLLMKVSDVMHSGDKIPLCDKESNVDDIILIMTKKRLGAVCVMNSDVMVGLITEGDIRRALQEKEKFFTFKAKDIMTRNFTRVDSESMAIDALSLMEDRENQISVLPVMKNGNLVGIIRVHDLLNVVGNKR
ncbi:KpsF/GutQ family sugar-phosphate isomerase [Fusobacterium sp. PH5-44]|uniref:KpsF/GutQ family sugar-phosphate isomerase n=1 Tax=unclassified Fusobacterium TaxID=2648384 RepID=UPI003D249108